MNRRWGVVPVAVAALSLLPAPANAVHLFPLTPTSDPLGHDCAKALTAAPASSSADVQVVGFNFIDQASGASATTVTAGETVAWTWALDHCHSVTFEPGGPTGTSGSEGFMPEGQPELVRMNGDGNDTFTLTFPSPGEFSYVCVHHGSVGMTGTVTVEPAAAAAPPPPPPPQGAPAPAPSEPAPAGREAESGGGLPASSGAPAGSALGAVALMVWFAVRCARRLVRTS